MKIKILQTGKNKDKYIDMAVSEFLKRLKTFCSVEVITLKEVSPSKTFPTQKCVEQEGSQILKNLPQGYFIIFLDGLGKEFSSEEFSKFIKGKDEEGTSLCFVIGGPFGLSKKLKDKASLVLSMSKMTLTHQMIRVFLLEQIYRAFCIYRGKEYHH